MKKTRGFLDNLKEYYYKEYKKLFWIPVILFLLSALVIFNTARTTGDFINRDVSLKGGISITIETGYSDINNLENTLNLAFPTSSINLTSN